MKEIIRRWNYAYKFDNVGAAYNIIIDSRAQVSNYNFFKFITLEFL